MPRGRVPEGGLRRDGPAAPEDRRPEGLAWGGDRLAPAPGGRRAPGRLPRGPRPLRRGEGGRRGDPELLHPGRRRHARPGRKPQVRPQARLLREADRRDGAARSQGAAGHRRRPERRARRERRLEPQVHVQDRQPHAGRGRGHVGAAPRRPVHRPDPRGLSGTAEAGVVVELSRPGLPPVQPRPAPGPHPGDARPARRRVPPGLGGGAHPRRRARMGTALSDHAPPPGIL